MDSPWEPLSGPRLLLIAPGVVDLRVLPGDSVPLRGASAPWRGEKIRPLKQVSYFCKVT